MAKTWFPHEEPLKEGEESKPLFGRKFSPFWIYGMAFLTLALLGSLWLSCSFVFSRPPT